MGPLVACGRGGECGCGWRRGSHLIPALPRRGGEGEKGCASGADLIAPKAQPFSLRRPDVRGAVERSETEGFYPTKMLRPSGPLLLN